MGKKQRIVYLGGSVAVTDGAVTIEEQTDDYVVLASVPGSGAYEFDDGTSVPDPVGADELDDGTSTTDPIGAVAYDDGTASS